MPTYIYECEPNNQEFEEFHSIKTQLEDCPLCKEKNLPPHKPKRLISGGSGRGIVELSGQEIVSKAKEDAQKMKKDIYSSEQKYANVIGQDKYHEIQTRMDRRGR
jgi:putative FmdB family regulatory protein